MIDLHLVEKLVEFLKINSGLKPTRFRPHAESRWARRRHCTGGQAAAQSLIDDILEAAARPSSFFAEMPGQIIIKSQRGAHCDIMMPNI